MLFSATVAAEPAADKLLPPGATLCGGYISKTVGPTARAVGLTIVKLVRAESAPKDTRWLAMVTDGRGHGDPYRDVDLVGLFLSGGWQIRSFDPDGRWYWMGYVTSGVCPEPPPPQ